MNTNNTKSKFRRVAGLVLAVAMLAALTAGCASAATSAAETTAAAAKSTAAAGGLSGQIIIDGSSTVFPITEAVSEEFTNANPGVQIPVGFAGTGGGFKKFIANEIDIANASRPIKTEEADALKAANIAYTEFKVGFDGITVVVNKENTWATDMTVDELKMIWQKDSTVTKWSDIRKDWPAEKRSTCMALAPTPVHLNTSLKRSTARKLRSTPTSPRVKMTTSWSRVSPATNTPWATLATRTSKKMPAS